MDCDQLQRILHPYLDGELGAAEVAELEEHCARCPECTALRDQHRALAQHLKGIVPKTAPVALRARVMEALDAPESNGLPDMPTARSKAVPHPLHHPLRHPIRWRLPAALGAALVIGWLLAEIHGPPSQQNLAIHDLIAMHQRSLLPGHPPEVVSSSHHVVKPWFAGRIDFVPWVDDLTNLGFPLEGGRVDIIDGRRVAVLMFRHNQHLINLVVRPLGWAEDGAIAVKTADGYQILAWPGQGLYFAAITDMNATDLANFAALVRAHP